MSYYLLVPPLLLLPPLLSGGADLSRGAAATLHLARRGGVRARRCTERCAHAGDGRRDRSRRVARVDRDGARGEPAAATRGQGAPGQEAAVRLAVVIHEHKKVMKSSRIFPRRNLVSRPPTLRSPHTPDTTKPGVVLCFNRNVFHERNPSRSFCRDLHSSLDTRVSSLNNRIRLYDRSGFLYFYLSSYTRSEFL